LAGYFQAGNAMADWCSCFCVKLVVLQSERTSERMVPASQQMDFYTKLVDPEIRVRLVVARAHSLICHY